MVRRGVDLLTQQETKPSREEIKKQALSIGAYKDIEGATDVSVNHDKYLAEIYAHVGVRKDDPD